MHTLYGTRGSGSAAIEIALKCCGLPYCVLHASSWEPESAVDELVKLNPLCQVPVLVLPDGAVLTESAAILIHLGLEYPNSGLLPLPGNRRAQAIRGLVFIAANCYAAISINDYPERWTTDTSRSAQEKVRQAARRQLHRNWELFADTFVSEPYLSGSAPGALDFLAAVVSRWSGTREHLAEHRPEFLEILHRIEAHEAVAGVFSEHWEQAV